jgi:hypothetical protein
VVAVSFRSGRVGTHRQRVDAVNRRCASGGGSYAENADQTGGSQQTCFTNLIHEYTLRLFFAPL